MADAPLLAVLRELKEREERAEVVATASRDEWIAQLEELFAWIRRLFEPAVTEGLARVDAATVRIEKDAIGDYEAPALKINVPGPRVVWVRPIGTFSVGARGMVDVVCGANRALLVLNRAGVWKVRGGREELERLDETALVRALEELVQ